MLRTDAPDSESPDIGCFIEKLVDEKKACERFTAQKRLIATIRHQLFANALEMMETNRPPCPKFQDFHDVHNFLTKLRKNIDLLEITGVQRQRLLAFCESALACALDKVVS